MTGERILVVDDEPRLVRLINEILRATGYNVICTGNGERALELVPVEQPNLILLDLVLPGNLDGYEICRRVREYSSVPVIMITARAREADLLRGFEVGADDYITKPFSLRELLSRIRAHLRRAYGELSNADASLLFVSDLVIDLTRAQVLRGDQPLSLTPTEFRLLVYLARHCGQVLSRAQIIDALWGYTSDADSERTVNVHIRRLREKIEIDPGRPALLLTVPGIGYRLAG